MQYPAYVTIINFFFLLNPFPNTGQEIDPETEMFKLHEVLKCIFYFFSLEI